MIKTVNKLTVKQENAAQAFIENGGNKTAAYRHAYNTDNMAENTVWRKAHELFSNGKVAARIRELMSAHRERHNVTIDNLTRELDENRKEASLLGQVSAMNAATMGKAKLHGLLIDKQERTGADGEPLDTHWTVAVMK